ncbi:hypothetical protein AB0N37_20495 [Streptomyces griseoincarnatus]
MSTGTPHPSDQHVPAAPSDYCSLISVKPLRMVAVIGGLPARLEEVDGRIRLTHGGQSGFVPTATLRRVLAKCSEGKVHQ